VSLKRRSLDLEHQHPFYKLPLEPPSPYFPCPPRLTSSVLPSSPRPTVDSKHVISYRGRRSCLITAHARVWISVSSAMASMRPMIVRLPWHSPSSIARGSPHRPHPALTTNPPSIHHPPEKCKSNKHLYLIRFTRFLLFIGQESTVPLNAEEAILTACAPYHAWNGHRPVGTASPCTPHPPK
jgi:hypothetical protein